MHKNTRRTLQSVAVMALFFTGLAAVATPASSQQISDPTDIAAVTWTAGSGASCSTQTNECEVSYGGTHWSWVPGLTGLGKLWWGGTLIDVCNVPGKDLPRLSCNTVDPDAPRTFDADKCRTMTAATELDAGFDTSISRSWGFGC